VLPSLSLVIKPTSTSITLACKDVFHANVRVHNDGFIRSPAKAAIVADSSSVGIDAKNSDQQSIMEMIQSP
jgi:hypothetical protein